MTDFYSRASSLLIKKETTANTAVIPNVSIPFDEESISVEYGVQATQPVAGDRTLNQRAVKKAIPAPAGDLKLSIEPKTFGHFLNSCFGSLTSGNYLPFTGASGSFTVGETVTGGSSAKTATVVVSTADYLLVSSPSGNFTTGETITGGSSGKTATVTAFDTSVFGHQGTLPAAPLPSYSLQLNFADSAIRYMGVRFDAFDQIALANNVMTATVKVMAQSQFRHAKVTAITTSGSTKTITVDQTQGLVATDTIKIFRPSTGQFIDLNGSGVKTEAITAVTSTTQFTLATLTTTTAVGDLVMLAPITPSYSIANEMPWVGGAIGQLGNDVTSLTTAPLEDFTLVVDNQLEERHTASGTLLENRFPATLIQKGLIGKGSFKTYYQDETLMSLVRQNTPQAFKLKSLGDLIGSTSLNYEVRWTFPTVLFDPFQTPITKDNVVENAVPFQLYKDFTQGYACRVLVVNTITSY